MGEKYSDTMQQGKSPVLLQAMGGVRKSVNGRELDGRTYDNFPTVAQNPIASSNTRKKLVADFNREWDISPKTSIIRTA
jgi:hypothetical protein